MTLLDPEKWDAEMVEAAQAVVDGLQVARQICKQAELPLRALDHPYSKEDTNLLFRVYDLLQDQLRIPVLVQAPEEEETWPKRDSLSYRGDE